MGGLFLLSWANLIPSLWWMPIPTFQRNLAFLISFEKGVWTSLYGVVTFTLISGYFFTSPHP